MASLPMYRATPVQVDYRGRQMAAQGIAQALAQAGLAAAQGFRGRKDRQRLEGMGYSRPEAKQTLRDISAQGITLPDYLDDQSRRAMGQQQQAELRAVVEDLGRHGIIDPREAAVASMGGIDELRKVVSAGFERRRAARQTSVDDQFAREREHQDWFTREQGRTADQLQSEREMVLRDDTGRLRLDPSGRAEVDPAWRPDTPAYASAVAPDKSRRYTEGPNVGGVVPGFEAPAVGAGGGKPPNEAAIKLANAAAGLNRGMSELERPMADGKPLFNVWSRPGPNLASFMTPKFAEGTVLGANAEIARSVMEQDVVEPLLRLASGAATPDPEVERYIRNLSPRWGDDQETLAFKMDRLKTINSYYNELARSGNLPGVLDNAAAHWQQARTFAEGRGGGVPAPAATGYESLSDEDFLRLYN